LRTPAPALELVREEGAWEKAVTIIFRLKREEVTGEYTKLHNEELHILCSSPNLGVQVKKDEMGYRVARTEKMRNVYKILVGKPEGMVILKSILRK
jgi:hypothetical protein